MENNDIAFMQDGGPERTNVYFSQCIHCVHFDRGKRYTCLAFPGGIPESMLYEMGKHDEPLPRQTGTTVFEKRPGNS